MARNPKPIRQWQHRAYRAWTRPILGLAGRDLFLQDEAGQLIMEDPPCPGPPPPGSREARRQGCRCRPWYVCVRHQAHLSNAATQSAMLEAKEVVRSRTARTEQEEADLLLAIRKVAPEWSGWFPPVPVPLTTKQSDQNPTGGQDEPLP